MFYKNKVVLNLLCFSLIGFFTTNCFIDAKCVTSNENQRNELKKQNDGLSKEISKTREQIQKAKTEKLELDKTIASLQKQISDTEIKIKELELLIDQRQLQIVKLEKEFQKQVEICKQGIKLLFKCGNEINLFTVFLNCKDLKSFKYTQQMIQSLSRHQNKTANSLSSLEKKISDEKSTLDDERNNVIACKDKLQSQTDQLEKAVKQNEKLREELKSSEEEKTKALDINSAQIKKLDEEIAAYYARQEEERKERERKATLNSGKSNSGNKVYASNVGNYEWPTPGCHYITAPYNEKRGSRYHKGIDIGASYNSPVVSAQAGTVISVFSGCSHYSAFCSCGGGYGNHVVIDHGDGKSTLYGHLSKVCVSTGQTVDKGQKIGNIGSSGHSTGPHLHFETRKYLRGSIDRYNPMSEY